MELKKSSRANRYLLWTILLACILLGIYAGKGLWVTTEYAALAREGISKWHPARTDYVIVIDYRKSILQDRIFVYNTTSGKCELSGKVSHAFNSGLLYATRFSNVPGSEQSCSGYFVTDVPYHGRFGMSMRVRGLEKGKNDAAYDRNIVFHPSNLVITGFSRGCFVTSETLLHQIIELTHDGCLVVVTA